MSTDSLVRTDQIDPDRACALQATLGVTPDIKTGAVLPIFFHQIYFWDPKPAVQLGRDGHPKTGDFIPDMGLPRRMWAGGQLEFQGPLIAGQTAERRSFVEKAEHKTGRTGPLGFVKLRHEIWQSGILKIVDWQDLVYREDPKPEHKVKPQEAPCDEDVSEPVSFDTTMLFRYSALTFNGHRIHYDPAYANTVEGYDGLVVHGPLLAQMLMLLAERQMGPIKKFEFRGTSALTLPETAELCWSKSGKMWVRASDGRLCQMAQATS
jgi:3-methylfumaryl-CoA hydratase